MPPKSTTPVALSGSNRGSQPSLLPPFDDNEKNVFAALFLNLKNKPDVDWEAVAEVVGFKNASTAKSRYGQICRKHGIQTYTQVAASSSATSTPVKGRASAATTPGKAGVRKATGRVGAKGKKGGVKAETEDDDEMKDATSMGGVKGENDDGMEM